jgi:hypothetical protein
LDVSFGVGLCQVDSEERVAWQGFIFHSIASVS